MSYRTIGYVVRIVGEKSTQSRVYTREGDAKRWITEQQKWRKTTEYEVVPVFMEITDD